MRFLKDYQLLATTSTRQELGYLTNSKRGTVLEYYKVGSDRAQIAFKQTVKQASARLNFE
jgi:hypothetical protein